MSERFEEGLGQTLFAAVGVMAALAFGKDAWWCVGGMLGYDVLMELGRSLRARTSSSGEETR